MILIDRSGSMAEEICYEGHTTTKAEVLAEVVNSLLEEIINRSRRERYVSDYFDVAIIGYNGECAENLLGRGFCTISDIYDMDTPTVPRHLQRTLPSDKRLYTAVERRRWIEPVAQGRTPMGDAMQKARRMVASWCRKHPNSFPPMVINITDGEATDADHNTLRGIADKIKACSTNDGATLLMNIHLAGGGDTSAPVLRFPSESEPLPTLRHSRLLYEISSSLPSLYNEAIMQEKASQPPFKAICYNTPLNDLLGLLAIGTLSMDQLI